MRTIITMMIFLFMTILVMVYAKSKIRPKKAWVIDTFSIEEEHPGPFPYVLGTINVERNYFIWFYLKGRGIDEEPKDVLSINTRTGEVLVNKKIDYETYRNLSFRFEARDGQHNLDTRLGVEIRILDINDHAPVFQPSNYDITLDESVPQGELVTTVFASDGDDPTTRNGTFTFKVTSVTPKPDNIEFYIHKNNTTGSVSFKGCLDYEKAHKYTILIEAKDEGDKVQLSSTGTVVLNIIDKNNHLPEIIGQTGSGKIKERESGMEVLRLQVSDKDSRGSPAWKAKFTLHGDAENYFKIQTDSITNEGIMTVIKAMDYEEQTSRNVSITVENGVPYFLCKVKTRTSWGLWDVETLSEESSPSVPFLLKPYPVTITVEDVNDPPEFVPPVKEIMIMENTKIGTLLDTLKVIDPDKTFGNTFQFVIGEDKDKWVTVDSKTGQVSVSKVMDRESPLVNHSTYSVIVYAVNKAQPPQTGTGTLVIHLGDENDNVPQLVVDTVSMCLSDEKTMTEISAIDLDLAPYSAPFQYELLEDEDMEGQWKIEPNHGTTANLIKESTVTAGHYKIKIKISDNQGIGSVQNLSITVCDCTSNANCQDQHFTAQPSLSAIGIMIFASLLLLAMLLMTLILHKKQIKTMIMSDDVPGNLIKSNIEMLGTDCKVPLEISQFMSQSSMMMSNGFSKQHQTDFQGSSTTSIENQRFGKTNRMSTRRCSYGQIKNSDMTQSMSKNLTIYYSDDVSLIKVLSNHLDQSLLQLRTQEQEFCDYEPHCYAYEEEPDESLDEKLDAISIPETDFHLDILTNLDLHFSNLAAVCRPDLM